MLLLIAGGALTGYLWEREPVLPQRSITSLRPASLPSSGQKVLFFSPHADDETIAAADTVGMFQLESSGQRNLNTRLKASEFEDIVAAISLFRPGPLEAEMITPFIRRRHGLEPVVVPHPAMGPVLRDSYGVIVYQEQVLQVAKAVAGFDLAEADSLRRAMTKDRSREEMEAIRGHFIERACGLGVEAAVAEEVFRQLEGFAAYGFCKAHAACFAVVSYASAWLHTYFPAEFAASILNHEPMGFYSPRLVLNDARRCGIAVLPPHVNASAGPYTVEDEGRAIRVGLQFLLDMPRFKVLVVGLEAGAQIPVHPDEAAMYHFLEGEGLMTIGDETFAIKPGVTVIAPKGVPRGMNAKTRLIFLGSKRES